MCKSKKAFLIINPNAGKKRVRQHLYSIIEELAKGNYITTVCPTQYRGHATELASMAVAENYDIVVCSGGDGTLNEVTSGIIKSGSTLPIGYIPSGSTNDFAATLGLSKNMQYAANDIVTGKLCPIDIGQFGDKYFSYVASFGIFTKASYATDQTAKNLLGSAAYILEGIKDIAAVHEYKMQFNVDDKIINDTFIFGAVANSTSLGGVISIDPSDVALDDGRFEYLLVKKPHNIADLIKAIDAIQFYDYSSDMLYFGSARHISVQTDTPIDWSLDGELAQPGNSVDIVNLHHAINLMLPTQHRNESLISESD